MVDDIFNVYTIKQRSNTFLFEIKEGKKSMNSIVSIFLGVGLHYVTGNRQIVFIVSEILSGGVL